MIAALLVSACIAAPTGSVPSEWRVTATATRTPTATPAPTYHAEATCVARGHQWTTDWKKLRNQHGSFLGSEDWPEEAHLQISVEATKPDHDAAWYRTAERCRRCKLWRAVASEKNP